MASFVTKALPRLSRPSLFEASAQWSEVRCNARKWNSTVSSPSSPSQLPVPGEPGWTGFIANAERHSYQRPFSPAEFQYGQGIYEMQKKI